MPDERKAAVRRLLLEKAILDELGKQYEAERARVAAMFDAGDRETAQEGGELLGAVTMAKGAKTARVTDPEAFLDWFRENRPEEIEVVPAVERVRPATVSAFLKRAKAEGGAFDKRTGEEVPGVSLGVADPVLKTVPEDPARELSRRFLRELEAATGSFAYTPIGHTADGALVSARPLDPSEPAPIYQLGDMDAEAFLDALRDET